MDRLELCHHRALVVGAGVAGLSTALGLGRATVLTGRQPGLGGSSPWAQGGIAAALGPDDHPARHAADTIRVAGGLAATEVVQLVAEGGPEAVAFLAQAGARFDRVGDVVAEEPRTLALGREAGHTRSRIVHAAGDSTGAEIMRALANAVEQHPSVEIRSGVEAIDLIRHDDRVVGVLAWHHEDERLVAHLAPAVVLATGGYGHAFSRTSTPPDVTGAGIAMASRSGAAVADMEFVQFHPTTLDVAADPAPLLTEALRGEGAILVDRAGNRFMDGRHDDLELAPRDVVARAVYQMLQAGQRPALDARRAVGEQFPDRFPTVFALAAAHGLDPRRDLLPVAPAAHYTMGGIAVDAVGRSSLPGLWAVGEVSSTGLHGANRLASNSLLEGVVLGRQAAQDINAGPTSRRNDRLTSQLVVADLRSTNPENGAAGVDEIRAILWRRAGVVRDACGIDAGLREVTEVVTDCPHSVKLDNSATVARLILQAARNRTESRGAHARADYPHIDPAQRSRRIVRPSPTSDVPLEQLAGTPHVVGGEARSGR